MNNLEKKNISIEPLTGKIYNPLEDKYIKNDNIYDMAFEIFKAGLDNDKLKLLFVPDHVSLKCISDIFSNYIEFLLLNILKRYNTLDSVCNISNTIDMLKESFEPIFNICDYSLLHNKQEIVDNATYHAIILNMITAIHNYALKHNIDTPKNNDETYTNIIYGYTAASYNLYIDLYSMFNGVFSVIYYYFKPLINKIESELDVIEEK